MKVIHITIIILYDCHSEDKNVELFLYFLYINHFLISFTTFLHISCEKVKRFSCLCLRFQNCKGDTSDVTIPKQLLHTAAGLIVKSRRYR